MDKKPKEIRKTIYEQNESIKIETVKRNQVKILELKSTIFETQR